MGLTLRYAARSDVGHLREGNEDSGYASPHLLVVADGMGGAAAGEVASSVAVAAMATLDEDQPSDLLDAFANTLTRIESQLAGLVEAEPRLRGMGTTLTAVMREDSRLGMVHVGDSRGYLLRGGKLERITRDHTLVQSLIDTGRLSEGDAATHPQRHVLTQVLDGGHPTDADLSIREIKLGDRILLCSDGLTGVVSSETIGATLLANEDPQDAVNELVDLALRAGGPDNITCVVADVVEDNDTSSSDAAVVVGAVDVQANSRRLRLPDTPAGRAARLAGKENDDEGDGTSRRSRRRVLWLTAVGMLLLGLLVGAAVGWYTWSQSQYFVGTTSGTTGDIVAIYRGPSEQLFGVDLSSLVETSTIEVAELPEFEQDQVASTIAATSLDDAREIVTRLAQEAERCGEKNPPAGCPVSP
ncbi:MAG TPA: protein phosphatase 2C domain-containing protein [Actinomycetes bacterium]|nr:protein phosphatase 2C domain-containing protein [Actinomycetes bacterium]